MNYMRKSTLCILGIWSHLHTPYYIRSSTTHSYGPMTLDSLIRTNNSLIIRKMLDSLSESSEIFITYPFSNPSYDSGHVNNAGLCFRSWSSMALINYLFLGFTNILLFKIGLYFNRLANSSACSCASCKAL